METICYRECPYSPEAKNLNLGWKYSKDILIQLNQKLNKNFNDTDFTIAVAGSFGRLEAGKPSDLDFFVLARNNTINRDIYNNMVQFAKELNLKLPNPDGVFSEMLRFPKLIDDMGNKDESPAELAQRLLMILETQPVYNQDFYIETVNGILDKYLFLHMDSPSKEFVILLNDLIKYFRYICVNYQFNFWHDEEKWVLRNIKLRHSRVVMYAGLLFLILNASKYKEDKVAYIKKNVLLTPIERIISVLKENNTDISTVVECYEKYIEIINNVELRKSLIDVEYVDRYNNEVYKELKQNSDRLQEFLTEFVFNMRGTWSNKAFEYLIF